jgi:hypothetical protein
MCDLAHDPAREWIHEIDDLLVDSVDHTDHVTRQGHHVTRQVLRTKALESQIGQDPTFESDDLRMWRVGGEEEEEEEEEEERQRERESE